MAAKTIHVDQRFELLAKLGANTNWDALTPSGIQALIDSPHNAGLQFTQFLQNGGQVEMVVKQFAVWMTITVPTKTAKEFITELEAAGVIVSDWARDIMSKPEFKTLKKPRTLKLAKSTVRDLGFTEQPTTDEIWARIVELGGELLPPEAGPEVRKNHADQKEGTAFWLAMKQIAGSSGDPRIFYVGRSGDGKRWLRADYTYPGRRWDLGRGVVFGLRE